MMASQGRQQVLGISDYLKIISPLLSDMLAIFAFLYSVTEVAQKGSNKIWLSRLLQEASSIQGHRTTLEAMKESNFYWQVYVMDELQVPLATSLTPQTCLRKNQLCAKTKDTQILLAVWLREGHACFILAMFWAFEIWQGQKELFLPCAYTCICQFMG